jgi:hypothetical protein
LDGYPATRNESDTRAKISVKPIKVRMEQGRTSMGRFVQ